MPLAAVAESPTPPMIEALIIYEQTSSSVDQHLVVPLMVLALLMVVAAGSGHSH